MNTEYKGVKVASGGTVFITIFMKIRQFIQKLLRWMDTRNFLI